METLILWGNIAQKYDTAMAHAMLHAIAVKVCKLKGWHR